MKPGVFSPGFNRRDKRPTDPFFPAFNQQRSFSHGKTVDGFCAYS